MKRGGVMKYAACLAVTMSICLGAQGVAAATTWYVDDDTCPNNGNGSESQPFCSVQAAIDAAVSGDTVLVRPGWYVERIDFKGKNIVLRSTDGPLVTILDGDLGGSVVTIRQGEGRGAVLEGFTITRGTGTSNGSVTLGGGITTLNTSPIIRGNIITGNRAGFGGGGDFEGGQPLIERNIIFGNRAIDIHLTLHITGDGGGLSLYRTDAEIVSNQIYQNIADRDGGGIWCQARRADSLRVSLRNNLIWGNSALGLDTGGMGGGAFFQGGSGLTVDLIGCTFTRNLALEWVNGVTLKGYDNMVVNLSNTILYGNGTGSGQQLYVQAATAHVTYSDVQGGTSGVTVDAGTLNWGDGNVDVDPRFADAEGDDFHLDPCSPLVDAGDPNFVPLADERDVDGEDRVLRAAVDIGADEVSVACDSTCTGQEAIKKAVCKLTSRGRKLAVKLVGGVPGDTFTVSLSSGESTGGTIGANGSGKAVFKNIASGPGTASVRWDCGKTATKSYSCP